MFKEPVESTTTTNPRALTDYELLRFSEDFVHGNGLPKEFQKELVNRFASRIITGIAY
jgi:hypothetical protein